MSEKSLSITFTIILTLTLFSMPAFAGYVTVYEEDFSSDPGWITDDPAKLCWDETSETFHGIQVNTEGTVAYINIPDFDPTHSWRLKFDSLMNSDDWSAGRDFGLFDSRLRIPWSASEHQGIADGGRGTALYGFGSAADGGASYDPPWSYGVWYRHTMEYDEDTNILSLNIIERADGSTFMNLSMVAPSFPADMTRLGVSRLHMKDTGPGASAYATVDYNLDNVALSVVPEPATISLLLPFGLLAWRRRHP